MLLKSVDRNKVVVKNDWFEKWTLTSYGWQMTFYEPEKMLGVTELFTSAFNCHRPLGSCYVLRSMCLHNVKGEGMVGLQHLV